MLLSEKRSYLHTSKVPTLQQLFYSFYFAVRRYQSEPACDLNISVASSRYVKNRVIVVTLSQLAFYQAMLW